MVIAMMHRLRGVVGGQRMRRGILCRSWPAPLAQRLFRAVGAVNVVADDPWLAGLGHGHVQNSAVVLGAWQGLGSAVGRARLRGVVIGDSGNVGNSGLVAAPSRSGDAAADAGGGGRRLSVLMGPGEHNGSECLVEWDRVLLFDVLSQWYSPVRLVRCSSGNELLRVVDIACVRPSGRVGPHTLLPLSAPGGVLLFLYSILVFPFGQAPLFSIVTIIR